MIEIAYRGASSRALEGLAWMGLLAGLLLVTSALSLPPPSSGRVALMAMTPDQLTAWTQAIVGAIGMITAALNGLAIAWHRWGKPARKSRSRESKRIPGPDVHISALDQRGGA